MRGGRENWLIPWNDARGPDMVFVEARGRISLILYGDRALSVKRVRRGYTARPGSGHRPQAVERLGVARVLLGSLGEARAGEEVTF
jgi:hypothetical protein